MNEVNSTLCRLVEIMEKSSPQDNGMIFETKKSVPNPKCAFKFPNLPSKKKETPALKKVGIGAERRKRCTALIVGDNKKNKESKDLDLISKYVDVNGESFDITCYLPASELTNPYVSGLTNLSVSECIVKHVVQPSGKPR